MAKKGKCINIECSNYKKIIDVEAGDEFVCPECGQPLEVVEGDGGGGKDSGSDKKKLAIIIAAAVVVIGGGVGAYFGLSGKEEPKTPVEAPVLSQPVDSTARDTAAVAEPVKEEPAAPVPADEPKIEKEKKPKTQPEVKNGHGTVNLGYGRYTGELKNGQPHGYGKITYTQQHKIVSSKDFVANPGDTFEGEFREGRISGIGFWTHDGNQTAVKP